MIKKWKYIIHNGYGLYDGQLNLINTNYTTQHIHSINLIDGSFSHDCHQTSLNKAEQNCLSSIIQPKEWLKDSLRKERKKKLLTDNC